MGTSSGPPPSVGTFALEEIGPSVTLAYCWRYQKQIRHVYENPGHHLILVESGGIEANTLWGTVRADAGDLLCFRPAARNEYMNVGPTVFYSAAVQFAPPPRHQFTPLLGVAGPIPLHVPLGNSFGAMRSVFETICMEITQLSGVSRVRLQAAVYEMLAILTAVVESRPLTGHGLDPWQRVRLRLGANFGDDVMLQDLAREVGVGARHFLRLFRERFGVSPKAYRLQAKVMEAARLLRSTNRPIKAIAYDLGFVDAKHLARAVKKHLRMKPTDLRMPVSPLPLDNPPWSDRVFPINEFLVPPETPADWRDLYRNPDTDPPRKPHRKAERAQREKMSLRKDVTPAAHQSPVPSRDRSRAPAPESGFRGSTR